MHIISSYFLTFVLFIYFNLWYTLNMIENDYSKLAQLSLIASMYYEEKMNQHEISEATGINRTAISRLLNEARDKNIVTISVKFPLRIEDLERKLLDKFPTLKNIRVLACIDDEYSTMLSTLGKYAAQYFMENIKNGMIVGLGWGKAIYEMIKNIPETHLPIELVQIIGATGHEEFLKDGPLLSRLLSTKLKCSCRYLHVPLIVENPMLSEALKKEAVISSTLEYAKQSNYIFAGLGSTKKDLYTLREAGYIRDSEMKEINDTGAVGDYLGFHYNIHGEILDIGINKRIIGIDPKESRKVENRVVIAGDKRKAEAILGGINGRLFNTLITDSFTARKLIKM